MKLAWKFSLEKLDLRTVFYGDLKFLDLKKKSRFLNGSSDFSMAGTIF